MPRNIFYFGKKQQQGYLDKIEKLTDAISENPYSGIGKPESLKHNLSGKWSRRITNEHRYVYAIRNNVFYIYSLKGHY